MNQKLGCSALGAIMIVMARANSKASLIYVPTEAGLPVTEARRLGQ